MTEKVKVIAEIGSVHDGSYGNALKLIDVAASCGADIVKFQTHIAEAETLKGAPMPSFFKDEQRYQYFERTKFDKEQWIKLKLNCEKNGVEFLSSPFSEEAVELLELLNVKRYKIPSGEVTNIPLISAVSKTKKPIILSSGMSSWDELDTAVKTIQKTHNSITVLQCTSDYPCEYENVGLNVMLKMKNRYKLPIGLSDHTLSNYAAFAAVSLGACIIEKHLTFSKKMFGSDAKHSSEPEEFCDLVNGIRSIEKIMNNPVDKNLYSSKLSEMRKIFQKSIVSIMDIPENTVITENMIGFKKPGNGLSPILYKEIIGGKATRLIAKNSLISKDDYEAS